MSNFSSIVCWKSHPSSIELSLYLSQNSARHIWWVYFWVLYSVLFANVSITLLIPHYLDYCRYVDWFLPLCSLFKIVLAVLGTVPFYTNFRTSLCLQKYLADILIEIALKLQINFWSIDIFTMLCLLIYECAMYLDLNWFHALVFCLFHHTDPVKILVSLYVNISFYLYDFKWYCVLDFGFCNVSFWYIEM